MGRRTRRAPRSPAGSAVMSCGDRTRPAGQPGSVGPTTLPSGSRYRALRPQGSLRGSCRTSAPAAVAASWARSRSSTRKLTCALVVTPPFASYSAKWRNEPSVHVMARVTAADPAVVGSVFATLVIRTKQVEPESVPGTERWSGPDRRPRAPQSRVVRHQPRPRWCPIERVDVDEPPGVLVTPREENGMHDRSRLLLP